MATPSGSFTGSTHRLPMIGSMSDAGFLLVTASNCHLCTHARSVLAAVGLEAREIDVGSQEASALAAEGVPLAFLPVLVDGTRVLAYGRLSERRLRKDLGR